MSNIFIPDPVREQIRIQFVYTEIDLKMCNHIV